MFPHNDESSPQFSLALCCQSTGRPEWNRRMLDFALRVSFEITLCQPYRAQTKGNVERGVKYVRGNIWPGMCLTGDADLNRRALAWCDAVANRRMRGTTRLVPWEMLIEERHAGLLPSQHVNHTPQKDGDNRQVAQFQSIAVHPRAQRPAQSFILPGQWSGLPMGDAERRSPHAHALATLGDARWPPWSRPDSTWRALASSRPCRPWNMLDSAASKQLPYPEMPLDLLGANAAARRERYLTTRTRLAHLPFRAPWSSSTLNSSRP